jgi:hypothetical protein
MTPYGASSGPPNDSISKRRRTERRCYAVASYHWSMSAWSQGGSVIRRRVTLLENDSPLPGAGSWRGDKLQHYGATRYHMPCRTIALSLVAPPNHDPPQERRVILQLHDATAYQVSSRRTARGANEAPQAVTLGWQLVAASTSLALEPALRHLRERRVIDRDLVDERGLRLRRQLGRQRSAAFSCSPTASQGRRCSAACTCSRSPATCSSRSCRSARRREPAT